MTYNNISLPQQSSKKEDSEWMRRGYVDQRHQVLTVQPTLSDQRNPDGISFVIITLR